MAEQHPIDRLSRFVSNPGTRREVVRAAAAIFFGLSLDAAGVGAAKKKGGRGKGKGKHKGGGKKNEPTRPGHLGPNPGGDDCVDYLDPELHQICKEIRKDCPPQQFCIHGYDNPGEDDRGVACCPPGKSCCLFGCTDTRTDRENCNRCGHACDPGQPCIDGQCGCGDGLQYCPLVDRCVEETAICCGGYLHGSGYCFPPFPCCGDGLDAFCSRYLTCP